MKESQEKKSKGKKIRQKTRGQKTSKEKQNRNTGESQQKQQSQRKQQAQRKRQSSSPNPPEPGENHQGESHEIRLWGLRQNNLKNISVNIPLGSFSVVCGPSGSGKSSLAFETLFAEGQRRYIESLSNYARQFLGKAPKPDVEGVENIPPAISIEQKNSVKTSRSTVGTSSEVIDYLRLLYEKIGKLRCPNYGFEIQSETPAQAVDRALREVEGQRAYLLAPLYSEKKILQGKKLLHYLLGEGLIRLYIPSQKASSPKPTKRATKKSTRSQGATRGPKPTKTQKPREAGHGGIPQPREGQRTPPPSGGLPTCPEQQSPPGGGRKSPPGRILEISPGTKLSELPRGDFYALVDRVVLSREDRNRLVDSLQQCYGISLKLNSGLPGGRAKILTTEGRELSFSEDRACSLCGFQFPPSSSGLFSFNNPLGACSRCQGFGHLLSLDPEKVIPNPNLSIAEGALQPFEMPSAAQARRKLLAFCRQRRIPRQKAYQSLSESQKNLLWEGGANFSGVVGYFEELETKKYKMHVRVFLSRFKSSFPCPRLQGNPPGPPGGTGGHCRLHHQPVVGHGPGRVAPGDESTATQKVRRRSGRGSPGSNSLPAPIFARCGSGVFEFRPPHKEPFRGGVPAPDPGQTIGYGALPNPLRFR